MDAKHGFSISKPISIWNKPLKLNYKDFFKSLGKATIKGVTLNWADAAKEAVDAVSAIGFEKDCGQIAWLLITRSMMQAIYALVEENIGLLRGGPLGSYLTTQRADLSPKDVEAVAEQLDLSLEARELVIDEDFFRRPRELPVVEAIKTPFAQWLRGVGFGEAAADSISDRLPSYFVFALNDEWRTRPLEYACLKEALDTPFTRASEEEQGWLRYSAWLQKQVDEPMFFEAFSLRQVYISLRAFYQQRPETGKEAELERKIAGEDQSKRITVDLAETLEAWLNKPDARDAVRVISGGPGCGKSSFTRMFAAHQAGKNDRRVIFVPLHLFEPTDDLIDAMRKFVRFDEYLPANPLDPEEGETRLLVIFDGLDELSMQGKVATEVSQNFVREVQKKADLFNLHGPRLKVLISGRELAVQSNVHEFRRPEQILHVLPYYVPDNQWRGFDDPGNRLAQDQRQSWWAAYGKASGKGYTTMPDVLNRDELVDVTSQPLLNYLVALSFARGKVDFAKESNLNVIYEDLLRAVYQRVWAAYPHPALKGIDEGQFFRVLEEIALAAWHGDGRTTTVREIEAHCEQSGLKPLLERFQEGASQGVTRLLLAFYFRQAGHRVSGDKTFEFTHKSFGEYLTARRIVRGVQLMHDELERRREYIESGWDERDALTYWAKLCGSTTMDRYIFKFICNEVSLRNQSQVKEWQMSLCRLISFMLRNGMPMERLEPRPVFHEETRQSRNAEEALLATLNACARFTETLSEIDWPSETALGEWISRLQGQRTGAENVLSLECLGYIVANRQLLHIRDFYEAIFFRASLKEVWSRYTNLVFANLEGTNLEGARLGGANLEGANLQRANLQDAILEGANLQRAELEGANLQGAIWTNGKRCLPGSIGKCIQEPAKQTKKKSRK